MTDLATSTGPIKLAIVGCGAIAEKGHLPAAAACKDVEVEVLVDKDKARARLMADKFGISHVLEDYRELTKYASAAVVAVPPQLHAQVSLDLLNRGVHVLVEKPMAMRPTECDEMIDAARANNVMLTVGLVRRYRRVCRFAKHVIDHQVLGRIRSFEVREGDIFGWPTASPFFLSKEAAGGGVLADAGVHVLDTLLWWFGDVKSLQYYDDDHGGVEANCELKLVMANDVEGKVELTRTHAMPNTTVLHGEKGSLTIEAFTNQVRLEMKEGAYTERYCLGGALGQGLDGQAGPSDENPRVEQFADFARAIRTGKSPAVDGLQGKRSLEAIAACYAQSRPLILPWVAEGTGPGDSSAGEAPGQSAAGPAGPDR